MEMLTVKKMDSSDIDNIAKLEAAVFSSPWSKNSLMHELSNPTSCFYSAFIADCFAGYLGANNILGEVYINNIAVSEEYRRRGVASSLLRELIEEAKTSKCSFLTLEVRHSNGSAIALYDKFGFIAQGIRPDFYENPREDAVIMTLFI